MKFIVSFLLFLCSVARVLSTFKHICFPPHFNTRLLSPAWSQPLPPFPRWWLDQLQLPISLRDSTLLRLACRRTPLSRREHLSSRWHQSRHQSWPPLWLPHWPPLWPTVDTSVMEGMEVLSLPLSTVEFMAPLWLLLLLVSVSAVSVTQRPFSVPQLSWVPHSTTSKHLRKLV